MILEIDDWNEYNIDLDFSYWLDASSIALSKGKIKYTGDNGLNIFSRVVHEKQYLKEYTNELLGCKLDWSYDYFRTGVPVGLHHDYDTVDYTDPTTNKSFRCKIVAGIFIPLYTDGDFHTLFYDKVSDIPKKLIWRAGYMTYKDNSVYEYQLHNDIDESILKYHPQDTPFYKQGQFNGLKLYSAYTWRVGKACVFNPARWHSSNWFLKDNNIPTEVSEYKISLIGFGSINV
jgi:hypothetical protein